MLNRRSYARIGRVRIRPGGRTSHELTRCQSGSTTMTRISFDRSTNWNHPAHARTAAHRSVPRSRHAEEDEEIVQWEFSEAMRSPRLSAAWFVLPSAALGILLLFAFLY